MTCHPSIGAAARLEPAVTASDCWLDAAHHLPPRQRPCLIRTPHAACGLRRDNRLWPLTTIMSSRWGEFFFSGLPGIDARAPEAGVRELLRAAAGRGAAVVEFAAVPAHGPVMQHVRRLDLPMMVSATWQRAVLDATRTPEQWWRDDISRKRRKEWARLKRRLEERGALRFETLQAGDDPTPWLDDFLRLEQAGWKGRRGTAIACDRHQTAFVKRALACFHAQGRLRFWRLVLDERPLATLFGFIDGATLWLGKIAYDEAEGKHSPGLLLTIEATRDILADPAIGFADSSADPDHPMIDHVWKQRLELTDVLIASRPMHAARWRAIVAAERLRRAARERVKRLYHVVRA